MESRLPTVAGTNLPAEDPGLGRAAAKGALLTFLPALALTAPIPFLWQPLFWGAMGILRSVLPHGVATYGLAGLVFFLPALAALPVAWLVGRTVRREGAVDPDRGRAVAAGACMAAAATTAGVIAAKNLLILEPAWIPLQLMASALGVGVLGAFSFRAVPAGQGRRAGTVPALYQGLTAAGLAGPALMAGAALWAAVGAVVPWVSPTGIARMLGLYSLAAFDLAVLAVGLAGLSPITALMGKALKRAFPRSDKAAMAAGLLFSPAIPALIATGTAVWLGPAFLTAKQLGGLGLVWGAVMILHGLAIALGLAGREAQDPELPAGTAPGARGELPA